MIPHWFTMLSVIMLALGGLCALIIGIDIALGHQQHMWIMNVVWPVTALFGTLLTLLAYFKYGRLATHKAVMKAKQRGDPPPNMKSTPFAVMVAKGTTHCGAGCALGDLCAEFLAFAFPAIAVWFGWKSLFPPTEHGKMFSVWILDFLFAFAIGIAFQYFTIKPMRGLSPAEGLTQALKADTLSLTAWQVGMYGLMALAQYTVFGHLWHHPVNPGSAEFWFTMQVAMLCGFLTSYPVNWWLVANGIKEKM